MGSRHPQGDGLSPVNRKSYRVSRLGMRAVSVTRTTFGGLAASWSRLREIATERAAAAVRLSDSISSFSSAIRPSALSPPFKIQEKRTICAVQVFILGLTIRKRSLAENW